MKNIKQCKLYDKHKSWLMLCYFYLFTLRKNTVWFIGCSNGWLFDISGCILGCSHCIFIHADGTVHNLNEYISISVADAINDVNISSVKDAIFTQKYGVVIKENQLEELISQISLQWPLSLLDIHISILPWFVDVLLQPFY